MNEVCNYGVPFALAAIFCLAEGLVLTAALFAGIAIRCTFHAIQSRTTHREG